MHGGNCDGRRVDMQIRCKQLVDRGEYGDCIAGFCFGSACAVRFHCGNQNDTLTGSLKFAVDTKMIAAECAGADDGNPYIAFACDCYAPLPSTAFRQRV
jgi:hypothetical protein